MQDCKTAALEMSKVLGILEYDFNLERQNGTFRFDLDEAPYVFARRYGLYNLFRKLDASSDASVLSKACWQSYLQTEQRIQKVNSDLRNRMGQNPRLSKLIFNMQRKIMRILGPEPSLQELAARSSWGPGATSTLKARNSTVDKKLIEPRLGVTPKCLKYAVAYLSNSYLWMRARIPSVEGPCSPLRSEFFITDRGRFSTVPKDTQKRRPIDIQPTLNLFFQKGVGQMIRSRLKRHGVNLDDQSRNQRLAELAYTQGLSTIDLEAASDSVSYELVKQVLPPSWFDLMDDLRTTSIENREEETVHRVEKFSSMGNGFTFELESLIFYALLHSIIRVDEDDWETPIAVYGDDLVCSARHYDSVVEALNSVGFVVNSTKSFKEGNFFESCGKHFYKGFDVTPPFQKVVCNDALEWVRFANRLWRWAYRLGSGLCLDASVQRAFLFCAEQAENSFANTKSRAYRNRRSRIPLPRQPWWLEGDFGLISPDRFAFDRNGIIRLDTFGVSAVEYPGSHAAMYCEALRVDKTQSDRPTYGFVSPRGAVKLVIHRARVYATSHSEAPSWI